MQERGHGPAPLPIVLTHGFPSSFLEYLHLLPLLTDPAAHGGRAEDAFDVVIASLPGDGFSDRPSGPLLEATVADAWCRLMRDGLGYRRFAAHGSDVGTGATIGLGRRHPESVVGIHLSAPYLDPPPQPWPAAVGAFVEAQARERAQDVAYPRLQSTRPLTVAYGHRLAGGAGRMDRRPLPRLQRLRRRHRGALHARPDPHQPDLYWVTATIGSSMRAYYDHEHFEPPPAPGGASRSRSASPSSPTAIAPGPRARRASSPSTLSTSPAGR